MVILQLKSTIKRASYFFALSAIAVIGGCSESEMDKKNKVLKSAMKTQTNVKGFKTNIEKTTVENTNFRKVLYTGEKTQLVLMSLKPNEEIGEETHPETDQFFRFESGKGKVIIDGTSYEVQDGDAVIIPAGSKHNVINTDNKQALKMYTLYSPPHHKDGIVRKTKEEAEANEEEFDGETTEAKR